MSEWKNRMYSFVDTKNSNLLFSEWLPSSAMSYDGLFLEKEIDGYQTLAVGGREMLSVDFETESMSVGSLISKQTLPSRTITVKYKLSDNNAEQLQFKFKKLMKLLYRVEDVTIQFNDELDYFYKGRYSSAEEVAGESNSVISSFTIFCQDPRKYTKEFISSGKIQTELPFETVPTKIQVTLAYDNSIEISNGREKLSITNAQIKSGDCLEFRIKEGKLLVNGLNQTNILDLSSDFKNFTLRENDRLSCNNGKMTIYYRGVSL